MTKRMLIDAAHPEETRVVIVDSNRVEELDFESRHKRQLRGNVYLARVTRVEPSLQAAFIEYGGNRHGFLAFSEIHSDYYRIPEADKKALKEQEEEDQRQADEEDEKRKAAQAKRKSRSKRDEEDDEFDEDHFDDDDDAEEDESEDKDEDDEEEDERDENLDPDEEDATDEDDAEVAEEQVKVASKRRKRISRRRYKIQEVIKRGQILLVQAVKEERGNKGAAMTTYLSLAGRYCVLMPNTPRGGGISRKISNGSDRKRLKTIMNDLEVPQGMGVIVRTAGAKRTKTEIGRDYEYLSRLWSDIRETTMESSAPALIHEEGNLVKRSIRDLYNKDIEEILVQGEDAYKTAHDFINMLMPSHAKFVKKYDDEIPLYLRYGAEKQIENSLDSIVQLKSGGYLVIHPTEALVSVDVNSGRSTKERNIERTALRTNLEAAEELARQMRLRDLAGLIVVDFIDMDEHKNNRAVERKMKDMLSKDRARIQTSRISQFGLMEISRQRRRRSLLEGSTTSCPHCSGVGRKRTVESSALAAIRAVEEFAVRGKAKRIRLKTSPDVALYLLNEKRDLLTQVDEVADVFTEVVGNDDFIRPHFELEVIEKREDKRADPLVKIERDFKKEREAAKRKPKKTKSKKSDDGAEAEETPKTEEDGDEETRKSSRRRSRRGRRGGRSRNRRDDKSKNEEPNSEETADATAEVAEVEEKTEDTPTRGRRKAPRKEKNKSKTESKDSKPDDETAGGEAPKRSRRRRAPSRSKDVTNKDGAAEDVAEEKAETVETEKPKSRSTSRRKAPTRKPATSTKAESTEKPETKAKSTRTRKAPAKKSTAKKATAKSTSKTAKAKTETVKTEVKKTSTRTRKAPTKKPATATKKAPSKKTAAKKAPAKKPTTTKAPAKKATTKKAATKKTPTKTASSKKAPAKKPVAKKAPAKKTTTKKAPVKKAPAKKAPAKKSAPKKAATKKAPAKKPAPSKTNAKTTKVAASKTKAVTEKTARTRKAPVKTAAKAETKSPAAQKAAPITAAKAPEKPSAEPQKKTEKKAKRGWWNRRKKD